MATSSLKTVVQHLRGLAAGGLSERRLLEHFIDNADEAAFTALVRRHGRLVFGVCRRVLGPGPDCDDAFQATFVVLARKAASIRKQNSLASWLYGVAYRIALRLKSKGARRRRLENRVALDQIPENEMRRSDPSDRASLHEVGSILDEELGRLPVGCRDALVICGMEGLSHVEAAQQLGLPLGTLKDRLQRGRDLLRKRLERRGVTLSAVGLGLALTNQAAAYVAPTLLRAAVKSAMQNALSATVAALADGAVRTLAACKVKLAVLTVATVGMLGFGAVGSSFTGSSGEGRQNRPIAAPPAVKVQHSEPAIGMDAFGDPLPQGAIARLGTVRWNHGGMVTYAAFLPDGKTILTAGMDCTVRVWEFSTGKEIRRFGAAAADRWDDLTSRNGGANNYFGAALSRDGKTLAIDGAGAVKLYDLVTGQILHEIRTRDSAGPTFRSIIFSPDGNQLAVLYWGGVDSIGIWDVATGKHVRTITAPGQRLHGRCMGLAYSPDGKMLVTSWSERKTEKLWEYGVQVWNPQSGELVRSIVTSQKGFRLSWPAFSPDGKQVAVACNDGTICVVDAGTGNELCKLVEELPKALDTDHAITNVCFGPTGQKVYSRSLREAAILEWDITTGKQVRKLRTDSGPPSRGYFNNEDYLGISLSPDGKVLLVPQWFHAPEFLDLEAGKLVSDFAGPTKALVDVRFQSNDKYLVTQSTDGLIRKWNHHSGRLESTLALPKQTHYATLCPTGNYAAVFLTGHRGVTLWDLTLDKAMTKIAAPADDDRADIAFSADGKTVALRWPEEQKIELYDVANGKRLLSLAISTGWPKGDKGKLPFRKGKIAPKTMLISAEGKVFAAYADAETFAFWDVLSGKKWFALTSPDSEEIQGGAFSPDSRCVALDKRDKPVALYELATGSLRRTFTEIPATGKDGLEKHGDLWLNDIFITRGRQLTISPDGKTLAHGGSDCGVHVWDISSGKKLKVLNGHSGAIRGLAFNPDGKTLASASGDTTALLWDVSNLDRPAPTFKAMDRDALWQALTRSDAGKAGDAIYALSASPKDAIDMLKESVKPAPAMNLALVEKLIFQLDDGQYKVRQLATLELLKIGERVVPAIETALKANPPLETRTRLDELHVKLSGLVLQGEALGAYRAVEVLECIGDNPAREILEALAAGAPGARVTMEAQATLRRVNKAAADKRQ